MTDVAAELAENIPRPCPAQVSPALGPPNECPESEIRP
jgi:hypothetical protein